MPSLCPYANILIKRSAIAAYFKERTCEAAEGKVLRRRLHYDQLTWTPKYNQMTTLVNTTMDNILQARAVFNQALSDQTQFTPNMTSPTAEEVVDGVTRSVRGSIDKMLELLRALGRDLQHNLYLITSYHRQKLNERRRVHSRYMADLRTRLQALRASMDLLRQSWQENFPSNPDETRSRVENKLFERILPATTHINPDQRAHLLGAVEAMLQATNEMRGSADGFEATRTNLDEMIDILDPDYIENQPQDIHGRRLAVMAFRLQSQRSERCKKAAYAEMSQITDPDIKDLVDSYMKCIDAYLVQRSRARAARQAPAVVDERTKRLDSLAQSIAQASIKLRVSQGTLNPADAQQTLADSTQRTRAALGDDGPDPQAHHNPAATQQQQQQQQGQQSEAPENLNP